MDYASWSKRVIATLIVNGFDSVVVNKVFDDAAVEIRSEYDKNELNSAGAYFVKTLEKYDLDLQIAWERGKGRTQTDLAAAFNMTKDEARVRWKRGHDKKIKILGWFRGEDVNLAQSFNF